MEEDELGNLAVLDGGAIIVAGCVEECESGLFLADADVFDLGEALRAIPAVWSLERVIINPNMMVIHTFIVAEAV